ncbi:DNA mismatch repair protein MLH3 [Pelomyxa schiedti]|nr:DNA mismatch repair protein MLH3 [Pelomyxa schiedti]
MQFVGQRLMTSKECSEEVLPAGRGESLANLARCCFLRITSRAAGSPQTFTKTFHGGKTLSLAAAEEGRATGTTIRAQDLFYMYPARRKTSTSAESITHRLKQSLEALALLHPNTSIVLYSHKGTRILSTIAVKRCTHFTILLIEHSLTQLHINGKWLHKSVFQKEINTIFGKLYSSDDRRVRTCDRYPVFIIMLSCPPSLVDFFSTTTENLGIVFQDSTTPLRILSSLITCSIYGIEALNSSDISICGLCGSLPQVELATSQSSDPPNAHCVSIVPATKPLATQPTVSSISPPKKARTCETGKITPPKVHYPTTTSSPVHTNIHREISSKPLARRRRCSSAPPAFLRGPSEFPSVRKTKDFNEDSSTLSHHTGAPQKQIPTATLALKPVLSTETTYVSKCALRNQSLKKCSLECKQSVKYAFDQHAVHERIKLEEFENEVFGRNGNEHNVQYRCGDWTWSLSAHEVQLLELYQENVSAWGFICHPQYVNTQERAVQAWIPVRTTRVPVVIGVVLTCEDLTQFLLALSKASGSAFTKPPSVLTILASKACRSAIMFGDRLQKSECEDLLSRLSQCRLPFQCAHGRINVYPLCDTSLLV